ncbi:riboflavin synthase [Olivibacter domesticus]|uniref:Riboflavin synthase n=1 Tax=Olivibacter domesticus TaxID=407022 RepID=A0A1H7LAX8_OLID1|nr:riboflavin synthase [Olivibacter domesticus]SEK95655.1 riboflavin synthase alpha chain [Olivibacter domesticus]
MFTGIIETIGKVKNIEKENSNLHFTIESSISDSLKVDQSVSHNGVCLTVTASADGEHTVTAIQETLTKTNLDTIQIGNVLNLERCTLVGSRLDGHIVQGHVDQIATCTSIKDVNGSWLFTFQYDSNLGNVTVEKGSIAVNGISLTVVDSGINTFSVAIIPYTYENTSMRTVKVGDNVNLEFDIIGKYVARLLSTTN